MIRRSDYTAAALGAFEEPTPMSRAQTDHTTTTGGSCALSCAICLHIPYAALYGIAEGQPTDDGDPALVAYGGDDRDAGGANADASGVNRRRDGDTHRETPQRVGTRLFNSMRFDSNCKLGTPATATDHRRPIDAQCELVCLARVGRLVRGVWKRLCNG